jgi:hypothetical protein
VAIASLCAAASCSLLVDWTAYVADPSEDATTRDSSDVMAEVQAEAQNEAEVEAGFDAPVVADGSPVVDAGADGPPPCPATCKGCCTEAGACSGGLSTDSCGTGGHACQNCGTMSLACVTGSCGMPSADAGMKTCVAASCPSNVCVPYWQGTCCKSDQTCGCMALIPQGPCM